MLMRQKVFSILALLLMAATGAWAQTETLLTTITPTGNTSYSETTTGVVTFTPSGLFVYSEEYGWIALGSCSLTVEAKEGYTITKCVFKQNDRTPVTITTSPFAITFADGKCVEDAKQMMDGVTSIEVYGPASAAATGYTVSLKDGVKDADKWTVKVGDGQAQALPIGGLKGDGSETVTLQYTGRLKVKGVKATSEAAPAAPTGKTIDLSTITADVTAEDGDVLTGTLGANVKISIADGATVTLDGVTINGVNDINCEWAGITCKGDATIILSGTNSVKGFNENYPGIYVPSGKTLTIQGEGSLTASPFDGGTNDSYGAGIGCGYQIGCGNINITGGNITAKGGFGAAGIGGGHNASCGNIDITGGTINATGGNKAAGIGSGDAGTNKTASCGNITIANTVTKVTATKGDGAPNSIGKGKASNNSTTTCGTVTIGGVVGAISTSPYTYEPGK